MECKLCVIDSHCNNHQFLNCNDNYRCDHGPSQSAADFEPAAPTLSLGKRILWLTETRAASGIIKWIGRIPLISPSWSAGIEFDNPVPNGGDGDYRGRLYFPSRKGHALFLPISELITVDDNSPCNLVSREPAAVPGRFPDSYSSFYYQKQRDSTYGHFRHNFCSSCERNEYQHNVPHCSHVPVYDRITSRRSLCYDDHPYETFNSGLPCESAPKQRLTTQPFRDSRSNGFVCNEYHQNRITDGCSRHSTLKQVYAQDPADYQHSTEDIFPDVEISRKDSIFSTRSSSFRLISGIKEWVSCWVLGVTKQRRSSNIFIKGRKTIASLIVSRGSPSLTGQRLSSFSEYATFNEYGSLKKDVRPAAKYLPEDESRNAGTQASPNNRSRRKKRQAPLPPMQQQIPLSSQRNGSMGSSAAAYFNHQADHAKHNSVVKYNRRRDIEKDRLVTQQVTQTTTVVSHTNSVRKSRKKRQAPLPPLAETSLVKVSSISGFENDRLQSQNSYNSVNSKLNHLHHMNRKEKLKHAQSVLEKINKEELSLTNPKLSKSSRKNFSPVKSDAFLDSLTESDSENNRKDTKLNSISFSGDESEDEKYGLVKYGMIRHGDLDLNSNQRVSAENHVQYGATDSDVCLKISIKKLETNVVTVEDLNGSRVSQFTIEEESSVSELSEEEEVLRNEKKPIITHTEAKRSSSESSSVSTDEVPEKSKTIFDELKLVPPAKGSVKDFVQAFNMLAVKGEKGSHEKKVPNKSFIQKDKEEKPTTTSSSPKSLGASALYAIQSFPTKWEYQTNQAANFAYPGNQFLMPIAEESSHNDTSEYDKNTSLEDLNVFPQSSNGSRSKRKKCKELMHGKNSSTSDTASKTCTHCSEPHKDHNSEAHTKSHKKKSVGSKASSSKETVPKEHHKSKHSTQASVAALASLLHEKTKAGSSKAETPMKKMSTKPDQPIMASLYIEDKSSHRGPMPLLVTPSMSLRKLKKQVEKEYQFPRDQQCWILGESFAVRDEASLASYGVTDTGCPVLLYMMGKDSKSRSLPSRPSSRTSHQVSHFTSSTSSESESESPRKCKSNRRSVIVDAKEEDNGRHTPTYAQKKNVRSDKRISSKLHRRKDAEKSDAKAKSDHHTMWEADYQKKKDYHTLVQLDDVDLVANTEPFECSICFVDIEIGDGAVLQECLHTFCRECLAGAIQFSDTAVIRCPFRNDEYSCESHLQEREIKSLVTSKVYEKHLQRSMALAESQAEDSFHCKTPDCQGWCLYEDNVNTFLCPVCKHTNCLTCAAIHEGKNCRQFQDDVAFRCDSSEEAKKTKEYLETMVKDGEAMECPKCQVILMKKWGCDWLKCSMCHTEVCWVTKGSRWGPAGKGDTSGGCKCMLNGVRCHPKCSYCH